MIVNAHDICRTRLCRAEDCPNDAEPYTRLCWRCARRDDVRLHTTPPNTPDTLTCTQCHQRKPDAAFPHHSHASHRRRYRLSTCNTCLENAS